jgi:hypothetical protein
MQKPRWDDARVDPLEQLIKNLGVATDVLRAIVRDLLFSDALWQAELQGRIDDCHDRLDAIVAHEPCSDRERSFATTIASPIARCRDGLRMIAMGLPRQRPDMIVRGELTVREATADIGMFAQILRR